MYRHECKRHSFVGTEVTAAEHDMSSEFLGEFEGGRKRKRNLPE